MASVERTRFGRFLHMGGRNCILVLLLLAGGGCRSATTHELGPGELSVQAVTLDLPLVEQDSLYTCGLASVSALCQYWNVELSDVERDRLARTAEQEGGLSGRELQAALDRIGMESYLFQGSLDRTSTGLYRHVDKGRPPLVMICPDATTFHYCLVLGYDEPHGNLILLDPAQGEVLTSLAAFDRSWARCQRFTLLACPKEETGAIALGSSGPAPASTGRNP